MALSVTTPDNVPVDWAKAVAPQSVARKTNARSQKLARGRWTEETEAEFIGGWVLGATDVGEDGAA